MPVLVRSQLLHAGLMRAALARLAQRIIAAAGEPEAQLSVLLVGDRRMRRLNQLYRGRDYPTDVLAFPMREAITPVTRHPSRVVRPRGSRRVTRHASLEMLGDVVISLPQAIRQAEGDGHSLDHELATLLIHGTLHLIGYDHEQGGREAERMRRKERAIMRQVGPIPKLVAGSKRSF